MCKHVACVHCGKPTFKSCGCGMQAKILEHIRFEDRCPNWPHVRFSFWIAATIKDCMKSSNISSPISLLCTYKHVPRPLYSFRFLPLYDQQGSAYPCHYKHNSQVDTAPITPLNPVVVTNATAAAEEAALF